MLEAVPNPFGRPVPSLAISSAMARTTEITADMDGETNNRPPAPYLVISRLHPEPKRAVVRIVHGMRIGRADDCELKLNGQSASRLHAEVRRQGPIFVLRDEDSRNGTWVDGARVSEATVRPGAIWRFGDWVGIVEELTASATTADPELCTLGPLFESLEPALEVAHSNLPIVLSGESGTGKEVAAQLIHRRSKRNGPFVAINCAAIPEQLAESELFGHRKGAFSGASNANVGYFRAAHGGTLFLDEVGELKLDIQTKLLRAIQEQQVVPVGEQQPIPVDVRIIAASSVRLDRAVEAGHFRFDLWMRLKGVHVSLPPLRSRVVDVPLLFGHLLRRAVGSASLPSVDARFIEKLCLYGWPGNVRELELITRRMAARGGDRLKVSHLPVELRGSDEESRPPEARASAEEARLAHALRGCDGNVARASRLANISRPRAYRLLAGRSVNTFLADIVGPRHDALAASAS